MKEISSLRKKLDQLEASGLISAVRFVRKASNSADHEISIDDVYSIHDKIFHKARPEIAGKLRLCEFKKLYQIIPPHSSKVPELMLVFGKELALKIRGQSSKKSRVLNAATLLEIVNVAAWTSYQISYIHPFDEGNGRTAREMLNLVLTKYKLPAIDIPPSLRTEYLNSLAQIDKNGNYEPFIKLISQRISNYYDELRIKKLNYFKSRHK